jgi:hypothetical protein
MHARKTAALAIIAGLATATSVIGATGSAMAEESAPRPKPASNAVSVDSAIKGTSAAVPKLKRAPAPAQAGEAGSAGTVRAANTPCYVYSGGYGDLCSWYLTNYGQSRGGFWNSSSNMRNNYFVTAGWGQGSWISNKAESVYNGDYWRPYRVFTNVNYGGWTGPINPRTGGNYNQTFTNDVESAYRA